MIILCTVDITTREVTIPSDQRIASYDHKVDVIRFQVETIPGFSLNTSSIKIAAQGPNKSRHDYAVDPSTVTIEEETGYITFDWPIPAGVTEMPIGAGFKYGDRGQLIFAVCAEIISGSTVSKAWHSDDGIITVVAHLEPESGGGEDPEEEATNAQKIAQLQTDVAVINTQVGALANGSPTPVSAVAEMTDESAVYLYTGSETGYTAGNWYFWNGTAWTSGGTYGGAVTSTTFDQHGVPADDFAVGEALAEKADADDVTALETALESKADADDVTAIDERVASIESKTSSIGAVFSDDLLYAGSEKNGSYYNNEKFKIACKIPANVRVTKVSVKGNSNADGEIPTMQILRKDGDNTYTVLMSAELNPLIPEQFVDTDVDINFNVDTWVAIGGCQNVVNGTASTYALGIDYTAYNNAGEVGGTVTTTSTATKMLYGIRLYERDENLTTKTIETVEGYEKEVQSIEICNDESVYSKEYTDSRTKTVWSSRTIKAGDKLTRVRFKAYEAGTVTLAFGDFSQWKAIHRSVTIKTVDAVVEAGWNEVELNLVFDRDVYIGIHGVSLPCFDYKTIDIGNVYKNFVYGAVDKPYFINNKSDTVEGEWTSWSIIGVASFVAFPITWYCAEGKITETLSDVNALKDDVKLIPNNADLRDTPVKPKYKVLSDPVGYYGKWYTMEINGQTAHVCNAAGGEFYFRTKGTSAVTILFGMSQAFTAEAYYAYNIDGGDFTRVHTSSPTITLPDSNWHIVRVVCDVRADSEASSQWSQGGGFVVLGVDAGNGSTDGLYPDDVKKIVHLGDSLAIGVRAFGEEVSGETTGTDVTSVTHSYSWYCSQALGAISYMNSYGGTGVLVDADTANAITMVEYAARGVLADPVNVDLVVIEHGHNDGPRVSDADFEAGYKTLLQKVRCVYPGVPIVCIVPINKAKQSIVKAVVPTEDDCYLYDTYLDTYPPQYYADGGVGHLLDAGARVIGTNIAKRIREWHLL